MLERLWNVLGVYTTRAAPLAASSYQWPGCTAGLSSPTKVAKPEKFSASSWYTSQNVPWPASSSLPQMAPTLMLSYTVRSSLGMPQPINSTLRFSAAAAYSLVMAADACAPPFEWPVAPRRFESTKERLVRYFMAAIAPEAPSLLKSELMVP